jgi:putative chitinase
MRDPFYLSVTELRRLAPFADQDIIQGIAAHSALLEDYGLTVNELRLCHFLAQAAHETAGFKTLVEYGGEAYFRRRYGHRRDIGNRETADGPRYRGRGIFQLTGRANYRRYGAYLGLDLENNPRLAARPENSLRIAAEYWRRNGLNRLADANDLRSITKRINGGTFGLASRRRYFAQAMAIWSGVSGAPRRAKTSGILKLGSTGVAVRRLQRLLNDKGFHVVVDGRFGRETRAAVVAFQRAVGLRRDGLYGRRTKDRLKRYEAFV